MFDTDDVARLLQTKNLEDVKSLFRSLFFSKLKPYTGLGDVSTFLWLKDASWGGLVECVRAMDGLAYFVVGDSHSYHYVRHAQFEAQWLAPLPIYYYGCTAQSLSDESAPSNAGPKILRWAQTIAQNDRNDDIPIFLKFGGMDAELTWFAHRFNHGMPHALTTDFDTYARNSIIQYESFVYKLGNVIDRKRLKVCSVFPASIEDTDFENRIAAIMGLNEDQRASLVHFEQPTLLERTILRGRYNDQLRAMCDRQTLTFVDAYSPLLDQHGNTDSQYRAAAGDHHIDHGATEKALVEIIQTFVLPACDHERSATFELSFNKKTLPQLLTALPEIEPVVSQMPQQPTVDVAMTNIQFTQNQLLNFEQENIELKRAFQQASQDVQTMQVELSSAAHQIALLTQKLESTDQLQVFANTQLEASNRTVAQLQHVLARFVEINQRQHTALTVLNQNAHAKGMPGKWMTEAKRFLLPSKLKGLDLSDLPKDFDPATYLTLNPDVAVAGVDPHLHYLRYGGLENRAYKEMG